MNIVMIAKHSVVIIFLRIIALPVYIYVVFFNFLRAFYDAGGLIQIVYFILTFVVYTLVIVLFFKSITDKSRVFFFAIVICAIFEVLWLYYEFMENYAINELGTQIILGATFLAKTCLLVSGFIIVKIMGNQGTPSK